jgi:DNA-directed RNA polymerase subunit N (RpoN/RPB10)
MESSESPFECFSCGTRFGHRIFTLTRAFQRLGYSDGPASIEVEDARTVSTYCDAFCREEHVPHVMTIEGVPIPSIPPGNGPIEICAICHGPVNMAMWHSSYAVTEEIETMPMVLQVVADRSLAVVCTKCLSGSVDTASPQTARERVGGLERTL